METSELKERNFEAELVFTASRSGGPGGQNVNKVSSRVELRFSISDTMLLSEEEKEMIMKKLKNRINKEGDIIIVSQSERSQFLNRLEVTERFYELLAHALTKPVKRKRTFPTHSSRLQRLEDKRSRGEIKKLRKNKGFDQE
jgi:ribosome-associated protein